jgi:ATP-dependent Clp protease protease subunit
VTREGRSGEGAVTGRGPRADDRAGALGGAGDHDGPGGWLQRQLFDRRVVQLGGYLDDGTATEIGAALMTLDATGDGPVTLRIDCPGGSLDGALALVDVIHLLGVPVDGWCTGQVVGPPVGVFGACRLRTIAPHGRLALTEPDLDAWGDATRIGLVAEAHGRRWRSWCEEVARCCGRQPEALAEDARRGRFLNGAEAVAYGLADQVAGRPDGPRPVPAPPAGH